MLNIEFGPGGDVQIAGRLDAVQAGTAQTFLDGVNGNVVLECGKLEYISSAGLGVLLAGLWWVQVVSARDYEANLEAQSYRTVRIPAVRGRILDRNGVALAQNQPSYNVSLYLEELHKLFDSAYTEKASRTAMPDE